MKTFLIAAGLMATMLGVTPAVAAPVAANAPGIQTPQSRGDARGDMRGDMQGNMRGDQRDDRGDRRMDRRDDRRGDRWDNGRRDNRQDRWNNGRGHHWGWNSRRCHNERRHHRWVRVCGRR